MTMYKGTQKIPSIKWGDDQIKRVYYGEDLVYQFHDTALPTLPSIPDPIYWFAANNDLYSDSAMTTLAQDGEKVAAWGNNGTAEDNIPASSSTSPVLRTGGRNGHSYLDVSRGQYLANLTQADNPDGILAHTNYTVFFVTDQVDDTTTSYLLGSNESNQLAKVSIRFSNDTISWYKPQVVRTPPKAASDLRVMMVQKRAGAAAYTAIGHPATPYTEITQTTNYSVGSSYSQFLRHTGYGGTFEGHLYEMIYFKTSLNATQCETVLDYLSAKYGYVA